MSDSGYLFDANVWVALALEAHPQHGAARAAIGRASSRRLAFFCRSTQQSFLRLITNPVILRLALADHLNNRDALKVLRGFMASSAVGFLEEPSGVEALWHRLATRDTASPKVWMDAYLAALAMTAGACLVTFDTDFSRLEAQGLQLSLLDSGT